MPTGWPCTTQACAHTAVGTRSHQGVCAAPRGMGTNHDREGLHRDPASGPGWQPLTALAGKPAGGHQVVHLGLQSAGLGSTCATPAHPARAADTGERGRAVGGLLRQRSSGGCRGACGGGGPVPARPRAGSRCPGQRGPAGAAPVAVAATHRQRVLAGGTMAVVAGLIARLVSLAVCTARDMSATRVCPAGCEGFHARPWLGRLWSVHVARDAGPCVRQIAASATITDPP